MTRKTSTSTKPAKESTTEAPKEIGTQATAPEAKGTETKKPKVKLSERKPDLGNYNPGDKVYIANSDATWTVQGPAQGGTTLKLTTKTADGKTKSTFRFARNITPAKK